jgi:hypothetical protein
VLARHAFQAWTRSLLLTHHELIDQHPAWTKSLPRRVDRLFGIPDNALLVVFVWFRPM